MMVEIPDPVTILGMVVAFLVGLGGLYGYYRIRPLTNAKGGTTDRVSQTAERLEYYERQLIDMKIRLDALEIQGVEQKPEDPNMDLKRFLERLASNQVVGEETVVKTDQRQEVEPQEVEKKTESAPKINDVIYSNPTDYVLHLITNKSMTSRDIQVTLKKSREHTARLMKKLFEDGYVQRNTSSKPYTYSITERGKERVDGP